MEVTRAIPSCEPQSQSLPFELLLQSSFVNRKTIQTSTRGTLAVEGVDAADRKLRAVTVPAGAIIKVLSGPHDGDGLVSILWEGRTRDV